MDLLKLSRTAGRVFMRLCGLSWRVRYLRPFSGRSGRARGRTVFFAFWHGRQLPLIHTHRNEGITVLVSRNRDGQYVTNVLHSMGFDTVRGSSSRGGSQALRGMAQTLRKGIDCAITPDGPRGPAERAKPGTAHISRLGARPVVPMGTAAWPCVRFGSWDRFMLPLPFSRIAVVEGRPLSPMARSVDPDIWLHRLEKGLSSVTASAELHTAPGPRFWSALCRLAGHCLGPAAGIGLMFRKPGERLERTGRISTRRDRPVWLHGSSLGELNGLLPYIQLLKDRCIPVMVTCFTPAGREFIDDRGLDGGFVPLDVPSFVERFLDRTIPRALILAETEIWPNMLHETITRGIPCVLVNGRLSIGSMKAYSRFLPLAPALLSCFRTVSARTLEDLERFAEMGVDRSILRMDRDSKFLADSGEPPVRWRELLDRGRPVLVAGSTRRGEETTVLRAASAAGYLPVLAPRHSERVEEVEEIMRQEGFSPVRWSELTAEGAAELDFDAVTVDVRGILASLYGAGDAAFVGGTLVPIGGHNVLEPLMRGVPVVIGPHNESFSDQIEVLRREGAVMVCEGEEEIRSALKAVSGGSPSREHVSGCFMSLKEGVISAIREILEESGILEDDGKT